MKIHENTEADGSLSAVALVVDGGVISVVAKESLPLPEGALAAVMARYGAPLDPGEKLTVVATLAVPGGSLRHIRHLARYDVIARDYLVLEGSGREPLCALANTVAGALVHLARAANRD